MTYIYKDSPFPRPMILGLNVCFRECKKRYVVVSSWAGHGWTRAVVWSVPGHLRWGWQEGCEKDPWQTKPRWWQLKYFGRFHPEIWGFMIHFDAHIFQMGWFNHQLVNLMTPPLVKGSVLHHGIPTFFSVSVHPGWKVWRGWNSIQWYGDYNKPI